MCTKQLIQNLEEHKHPVNGPSTRSPLLTTETRKSCQNFHSSGLCHCSRGSHGCLHVLRFQTSFPKVKELLFFFCLFFFLAALGLCCCAWAFSSRGERGLLFFAMRGLLIAVASLVAEHRLQAQGLQWLWLAGFSSCGSRAQQLWLTSLVALQHVGSSQTRA